MWSPYGSLLSQPAGTEVAYYCIGSPHDEGVPGRADGVQIITPLNCTTVT